MVLYRHYRTKDYYIIIGKATHTETHEELILYSRVDINPLEVNSKVWARPKDLFYGKVFYNNQEVDRFDMFYYGDKDINKCSG